MTEKTREKILAEKYGEKQWYVVEENNFHIRVLWRWEDGEFWNQHVYIKDTLELVEDGPPRPL